MEEWGGGVRAWCGGVVVVVVVVPGRRAQPEVGASKRFGCRVFGF